MNIIIVSLANGSDHQRYTTIIANNVSAFHNVKVICSSFFDVKGLNQQIKVNNFIQSKKTRLEPTTFNFKVWKTVFYDIKQANPDIIHFISAHPLNILLALIFMSRKKIFTLHDVEPHPGEKISTFVKIYNFMVKLLADTIVVHSKMARCQLGRYEYKGKVLPLCGIKTDVKEVGGDYVLFYGRIKPYKGLDLFIKAAEYVIERNSQIKFVIAGAGNIDSYMPLIKNKENFVIMNEYISNLKTDKLFRLCRFLVLPYYSATQSGIIPVAYSYNKPVIATSVGAIPEMVDDKVGFLVEPDVIQIAEKMILLWDNKCLYEEKINNIKFIYNQRYSEENMASEFRQFYEMQ